MLDKELKSMDVGSILDRSFKLVFDNFRNCLKIIIIYYPLSLLFNLLPFFLKVSTSVNVSFIFNIADFLISIIFTSMFIDLFIKGFLKKEWKFIDSLKFIMTKYGIIIGASFLSFLIIIGGVFLFIIGSLIFATFLMFVIPSVLYENKSPGAAISRSFKLVSYNFWSILGAILLILIIFIGIVLVLIILLGVSFGILFSFDKSLIDSLRNLNQIQIPNFTIGFIILGIIIILLYFILILISTFVGSAFTVIMFFNQKIKNENFGVEILANSFIEQKSDNYESIKLSEEKNDDQGKTNNGENNIQE